jgi:hypothetical protein
LKYRVGVARRRHRSLIPFFQIRCRVGGSDSRVDVSDSRVDVSDSRVDGSDSRVDGSGFRVDGSNFRVRFCLLRA